MIELILVIAAIVIILVVIWLKTTGSRLRWDGFGVNLENEHFKTTPSYLEHKTAEELDEEIEKYDDEREPGDIISGLPKIVTGMVALAVTLAVGVIMFNTLKENITSSPSVNNTVEIGVNATGEILNSMSSFYPVFGIVIAAAILIKIIGFRF